MVAQITSPAMRQVGCGWKYGLGADDMDGEWWMGMGVDDMGRAGDVAYFFKNSWVGLEIGGVGTIPFTNYEQVIHSLK